MHASLTRHLCNTVLESFISRCYAQCSVHIALLHALHHCLNLKQHQQQALYCIITVYYILTSLPSPEQGLTKPSLLHVQEEPGAAQGADADTAESSPQPEPHHIPIPVLFGTEYGFCKEIAERLCEQLQAKDCFWYVPVLVFLMLVLVCLGLRVSCMLGMYSTPWSE